MADRETREKMAGVGDDPIGSSPDEFARFLHAEVDKWPARQGSIPDPWLTLIWAGLSPAGSCSIAMPQPRPDTVARTYD